MNRKECCCFTGHRPEKLPWGSRESDPRCQTLKAQLAAALDRAFAQGYRHFLCGMARGTDLYFCEAVLQLRKQHPEVTLEAAIPFPGQAERWNKAEQARYDALLSQCNYESVVQHSYTPGCLQRRNRYLVDHASLLIAAYNGKGGGTLYTLTYAMQQGIDVVVLDV